MSYRIMLTTTRFKDLGRATETFAYAQKTLMEDEYVRLIETQPGTWVVAFFNSDDDSLIGCL